MKKVIILSAAGLLSFALSTAGIYLAMPSIAPAVVHETSIRLDRLGLVPRNGPDSLGSAGNDEPMLEHDPAPIVADVKSDTSGTTEADRASSETTSVSDVLLKDSLRRATNIVSNLERNNAILLSTVDELEERLDSLQTRRVDASELNASLTKLEDKQLGNILVSLDLEVVEMLYMQASARERSRLLQHLPPDQAARFVRTLVGSAAPGDETVEVPPAGEAPESETPNL